MIHLTHAELWGYRADSIRFPADGFDDMVFEWARKEHANHLRRHRETWTCIGMALGVHRSTAKRYVSDSRYLKRERHGF